MTHSANARLLVTTVAASLTPIGEEIEEQFAADPIEGHNPQFVDDQDIDAEEPLLQARERRGGCRAPHRRPQPGDRRQEP
jgi:hypothetical protein